MINLSDNSLILILVVVAAVFVLVVFKACQAVVRYRKSLKRFDAMLQRPKGKQA